MQYNEVYKTGKQLENGDGQAYDFDFGCKDCIIQYNYSQNNHGFLLIMHNTVGNIVRFNISENNPSHLIQMHGYKLLPESPCINVGMPIANEANHDLLFHAARFKC